jgi:hypothetical protein
MHRFPLIAGNKIKNVSPPSGKVNPFALVTLIFNKPFLTVGGAGVPEPIALGVGVVDRDASVGVCVPELDWWLDWLLDWLLLDW